MEFAVIIVVIALGIFLIAVSSATLQNKRKAQMIAEAQAFVTNVEQARALPVVPTSVTLKAGEAAFYAAPAALYETRAVRQYRAGHAGFRVASRR